MKFTDYLSRNPVGGAPTEDKYDEEHVINILPEQHAKLNAKYGSLFDSQSDYSKQDTETKRNTSESENEQKNDQSHSSRIPEQRPREQN